MALLTETYLQNLFRVLAAEYDSAGRWSEADIDTLLSEAQNWLAMQVQWPKVHGVSAPPTGGTIANQQEYQLPDTFLSIDRVYLAGQAMVPTDIETMEGIQIEYYDQSATNYQPQWSTQTAVAYPYGTTQMGYPQGVSPFTTGDRGKYYLDGVAYLGFVPPPAAAYQIDIWGVGVPNPLTSGSQSDFPLIAARCLCYQALGDGMFSDENKDRMQSAFLLAKAALVDVRSYFEDHTPNKNRGWRPITYRNHYKRNSILGSRKMYTGG